MSTQLEISQKTADAINKHGEFATGGARLIMIRLGLRFEIRSPGMRLTSKAPKCTTILRREFGLKGNPLKLLSQFEDLLEMVGVVKADDKSTELGPDGKLRLTAEHRRN
jgi:hypothetical protein